jgi:septal ring factor EnvC (AmiA/AmiB activator)
VLVPARVPWTRRVHRFAVMAVVAACTAAGLVAGHASPVRAEPSLSQLEKSMDDNWSSLETVGEKYEQAEDQLATNQAKSAALAKQIAPLQTGVDAVYQRVGQAAAQAYEGGQLSALNAVLDSGSPTTALDQLSTLDWIAGKQHEQVASLEKQATALAATKKKYDALVASNTKAAADLSALKTKLTADMARMQQQYMGTAASRDSGRTGLPATTCPTCPAHPARPSGSPSPRSASRTCGTPLARTPTTVPA